MNKEAIAKTVSENPVVLFMKGTKTFPQCGFSSRAAQVLKACNVDFVDVNVLAEADTVPELREFADWPTIPVIYIKGEFIGGCDIAIEMYQAGELQEKLGDLVKTAA